MRRCLVLAVGACLPLVAAAAAPPSPSNLADLSLEELGNLRVTTASLRPERWDEAPASIFVITNDDIRRSGATSLPEALRLAPNLEVAQVSASTYAISARGFQNVITNKLLVLVDGRTLYTTVLSGVLWDAQDVMLDDVDRIEVISGPGAALYGANAFVGVINVITRHASATQGALLVAGGGSHERNAAIRYGGALGGDGAFRAYVMHIERDGLRPAQAHLADDMQKDQAGFRVDFGTDTRGTTTFQGDAYHAAITGNGAPDLKLEGANLLARWSRLLRAGSRVSVQAYYDHALRDDPAGFTDKVDTFDVEAQHDLAPLGAHRISYGAGYRVANDDATPTAIVRFIPEDARLRWGTLFGQDKVDLSSDVTLTAGAKVQSTPYVKPEWLPDLRLDWNPSRNQFAWIAASRVARTPGRVDRDLFFPGTPPFIIKGSPDFRSETGKVVEVGYRAQPNELISYSVTAFHARLDDLRGGRAAPGGGAYISNEAEGTTRGIEAWAIVQPHPRWRITAGWLELRQDLHPKPGSTDTGAPAALGNDPRHTYKLRSGYRIDDRTDFDIDWRYVSALSYLTTVPSYQALDARIAWRLTKNIELSVVGRNLTDPGHVEFDEHGLPAAIPRSAYFQLRASF